MLNRPDTDIISDILEMTRLRTSVYANPQVCGQWRLDSVPHGAATFHFIVRGSGWLHMHDGSAPRALRSGDLVVFARDVPHALSDGPDTAQVTAAPDERGGPVTELICGQFDLAESGAALLLEHLPSLLVIESDAAIPGLSGLARLLASEAETSGLGRQLVLDRLSDVLFVAVLRFVVANQLVQRGVLAGLREPRVAAALEAMTRRPGDPWSIAELARRAGMSRTSFAQLFASTVGEPPMAWLTRLRMERAAGMLRDRRLSVGHVASQLGYGTEAAFRRAFKRSRGVGPGALRRHAPSVDDAAAKVA